MTKKAISSKLQESSKTPSEKEKKVVSKSVDSAVKNQASDKRVSRPPAGGAAATMDELMSRKAGELVVPKKGTMMKGVITDVTSRMVLIDIGAKTEGIVTEKEFDAVRDYTKSLKPGEEVLAYVLSPENDRGQILLALRNAAGEWQWEKLSEWMRKGEIIEIRGLEINKGGLVARIDSMDIQGFVPTSQLSAALTGDLDALVNRVFKAKIIEVDRKNNRLIFSERYVSEQGEIAAKREVLSGVKIGMKVKGKIVGLTDFGAFVRVSINKHEIEGLIHVSELSWDKVAEASSAVKEGQEVTVAVIDVNPDLGKIGFSLKQLLPDPWNGIEGRYTPGKKINGTVLKVAAFGAIIQLEPGISGLLHISKIPTGKEPSVGDTMEVIVEDLDIEHRKLSLGVAMEDIPTIYR